MRVARVTTVAAIVVMALLVAPSAPASAAPTGTERLTLVTTSFTLDTASGRVVATGPVAGAGTFFQGPGDVYEMTVDLPQGDLFLLVENTSFTIDTNERACVDRFSGTESFVVTGGSGAFSGASGRGSDSYRGTTVYPRNADGTCNFEAVPRGFIIATAVLTLT